MRRGAVPIEEFPAGAPKAYGVAGRIEQERDGILAKGRRPRKGAGATPAEQRDGSEERGHSLRLRRRCRRGLGRRRAPLENGEGHRNEQGVGNAGSILAGCERWCARWVEECVRMGSIHFSVPPALPLRSKTCFAFQSTPYSSAADQSN